MLSSNARKNDGLSGKSLLACSGKGCAASFIFPVNTATSALAIEMLHMPSAVAAVRAISLKKQAHSQKKNADFADTAC
jgi:hypothetical protein|tara:strand:+ start:1100 stop:1333 length:234 start_codon:yes stop_codon:yes gene_type:complete